MRGGQALQPHEARALRDGESSMGHLLCVLGLHAWIKWGGTRTSGLFRRCQRCACLQEGVEGRRSIHWIDAKPVAGSRAKEVSR